VIVFHNASGPVFHLIRVDAWIDPDIPQGVVKALHVFRELEWNPAESPGGIEHSVSINKTPVPYGNPSLRLRYQFPVQIDDGFRFSH
jgi:hypothetical protein